MPLIRPFNGLRPAGNYAAEVAAPPYDVLNTEEARSCAKDKPWSFLHISKPEIDLPASIDKFSSAVYDKGKHNFDHMLKNNILKKDPEPAYYLYRLIMGDHSQVGLVAVASVDDYNTNRIRKHEFTRPDKEKDRVQQIDSLGAQTGPVFLTYRYLESIDTITKQVVEDSTPAVDIVTEDRVRHTLWLVNDKQQIDSISSIFDNVDFLYIADGHHRSAAASKVAAHRRAQNDNHTGGESYNYFLTVLFPDNEMQILDYNRVIKDLNGLSLTAFLDMIRKVFNVELMPSAVKPRKSGEFGMYLDQHWYQLVLKSDFTLQEDPVKKLDVSLLADNLIAPILGIVDQRIDKRIDFVGGIRGLGELEKRVNSGDNAVAFSLYPTSLDDLMAVADAGQVMPPKSTWFEPKLADGIVSHLI